MAKTKFKQKDANKDGELNREDARRLVQAYCDNRHGRRDTFNHSVYGEFDLVQLINFLLKMSDEHQANGVRIYYGARQVPVETGSKEITYAITPVIVTTRRGFTGPPFEEILSDNKKDEVVALSPNVAYDFASLCPPDRTHVREPNKSLAYDVYGAKKKTRAGKVITKK